MKYAIIISVFYFYSCSTSSKNQESTKKQVDPIAVVLPELMDSLIKIHELQSGKFKISDNKNKELKSMIINNTLKELSGDSSNQAILVSELAKIINNPICISIENESKETSIILLDFSPVAIVENTGCFYVGIECGKNCSSGYIVFISQVDKKSKWKIVGLIRRWHS